MATPDFTGARRAEQIIKVRADSKGFGYVPPTTEDDLPGKRAAKAREEYLKKYREIQAKKPTNPKLPANGELPANKAVVERRPVDDNEPKRARVNDNNADRMQEDAPAAPQPIIQPAQVPARQPTPEPEPEPVHVDEYKAFWDTQAKLNLNWTNMSEGAVNHDSIVRKLRNLSTNDKRFYKKKYNEMLENAKEFLTVTIEELGKGEEVNKVISHFIALGEEYYTNFTAMSEGCMFLVSSDECQDYDAAVRQALP